MFTIRNSIQIIGIICFLNLIVLQILFQSLDQNAGKAEDLFFVLSEERIAVKKLDKNSKSGYKKLNVIYGTTSDLGARPHPFLPSGVKEINDRIEEQLSFTIKNESNVKPKIILDLGVHGNDRADTIFIDRECPVTKCKLIRTQGEKHRLKLYKNMSHIDAVLLTSGSRLPPKLPHHIWVISSLESPQNNVLNKQLKDKVNWTYTYRRDSTIVTPYFRYKPLDHSGIGHTPRNYAAKKRRLVAWFVSNCGSHNGRLGYARELQKYIPVHIYGECGNYTCQRFNKKCDSILDQHYKFYLSFENSLCKDYMTEKLHMNAFERDVVPVVMGATYKEYLLASPPNSFIHVDNFTSPQDLAKYLLYLHNHDEEYNKYFRWKGTGTFIDTKTICRLCALLHADLPPVWYEDVSAWWRADTSCRKSNYTDPKDEDSDDSEADAEDLEVDLIAKKKSVHQRRSHKHKRRDPKHKRRDPKHKRPVHKHETPAHKLPGKLKSEKQGLPKKRNIKVKNQLKRNKDRATRKSA